MITEVLFLGELSL